MTKREEYLADPYLYFEDHLKIRTKEGKLIPFTPNGPQRHLIDSVMKDLKEGTPVRYVILKGRQMGLSTAVQALLFWQTIMNEGYNTLVMAHDNGASENLFQMTKRYNEGRTYPKMKNKKDNKREIIFDKIESRYICKSVASPSGTRSFTIHGAHLSEVAFWNENCTKPEETFNALMESIPESPGTMVFVESTANGLDFFKELCDIARFDSESPWKFVFYEWFQLPQYSLKPSKTFVRTAEENKIARRFGLDDGQLTWRRRKVKGKVDGKNKFMQEYPCCPEEAFLKSGKGIFDAEILDEISKIIKDVPIPYYDLDTKNVLSRVDYPTPYRVYQLPRKGETYYMGVDVALGKGLDHSVVHICDSAGRDCLVFRSNQIEPHSLAAIANELGLQYNYARINVENNGPGLTVISGLVDLDYNNFFYNIKWNGDTYTETNEKGFRTTGRSKSVIINTLQEYLTSENLDMFRDPELIAEMYTYISKGGVKMEAAKGCHDDVIIAKALSTFAWKMEEEFGGSTISFQSMYITGSETKEINLSAHTQNQERQERDSGHAMTYLSPIVVRGN